MKVKIGKYVDWIGPYQIANAIFFWIKDRHIISDDDFEQMERRLDYRAKEWLSDFLAYGFQKRNEQDKKYFTDNREHTWFYKLLEWIGKNRKRTIKVHIDRWDTWSMDSTLSLIVVPMLEQLKESKHGAPFVDDKDVPKELRSTSAPPKENKWDTDENHFKRWDWVLDEMIWAHKQKIEDNEPDFWIESPEGMHSEPSKDNPKCSYIKWDKKGKFDKKAYNAYEKRKLNGFRLFGRYYQNLWD